MKMAHINNPFFLNRLICWLWGKWLCPRGVHLFDEVLLTVPLPYINAECGGCGCHAQIVLKEKNEHL